MSNIRLRTVLALAAMQGCAAAGAEEPERPARPTAELIRQLDAERFRDRETAQKELLKRRDALPVLYRSLPKLPPEGARRATAIVGTFLNRRTSHILQLARTGRIDLLVEWSALTGAKDDPPQN
jgi:hypothetical protein